MKKKKLLIYLVIFIILIAASMALVWGYALLSRSRINPQLATTTSSVQFISSTITVDGSVTAQDMATLHFQTAGKLVYLPLKEGDKVYAGQAIAQLDTYSLQRALASALNTYRSTRNTFDQTQANAQNNVLQTQQTNPFDYYSDAGIGQDTTTRTDALNDVVKRIIDQNQANLDNSVINVELAHYALQLATLISPLNGIVTHEDVNVAGQNVTTATSFTVADPATAVFRANIPTEYIYYITEGSVVTVAIDGLPNKIQGTIVRIYPSKVTLPSSQAVYQVDIQSDDLKKLAKLDMDGTAILSTNSQNVALVPAWTVLSGKYIWVDDNGKPKLKQVTVGKIHRSTIEVTSGLSSQDKIIINPKYIPSMKYSML